MLVRQGPEFVPMSRAGKIREWAEVIQVMLRDREDGGVLADLVALGYAERFWATLEAAQMPVADIMVMSGANAANWTLATYKKDLIAAGATVGAKLKTQGKPHEEGK